MSGDLVFSQPPVSGPADLIFGGEEGSESDAALSGAVLLPDIGLFGAMRLGAQVAGGLPLPGLGVSGSLRYSTDTARPLVCGAGVSWQAAQDHTRSVVSAWQPAQPSLATLRARQQAGRPESGAVAATVQDGLARSAPVVLRNQAAEQSSAASRLRHQTAQPVANALFVRQQRGLPVRHQAVCRTTDGVRDRQRGSRIRWQRGVLRTDRYAGPIQSAVPWPESLVVRYQLAMPPPAGRWIPEPSVPPPADPCYLPDGNLVFDLRPGSSDLVFVCERHGGPGTAGTIVVPVRRLYMVMNEASLRRVDGDVQIPVLRMAMALDRDSWTWTFSASIPGAARGEIEPAGPGVPVEVEAFVNGQTYRFLIEQRSRERSFGRDDIRVAGRGLAAALDITAYNFGGYAGQTAAALLGSVLTLNGVSIGWAVDFGLEDWFIPAGRFSHQGTYISATRQIAAAAGGYVQPHPTDSVLRVLPDYPYPPWEWDAAVPDYEIPSDVVLVESTTWVEKANYNRVWVAGMRSGDPIARITRQGTDGAESVASTVLDPLITAGAAARQRGTSILSSTGLYRDVTLKMPVLAGVGVVEPGRLVRYVDSGVAVLGLTRSVNVDVSMPEVWQTVGVEVHA